MREALDFFIAEVVANPKLFVRIAQHYVGSRTHPGVVISMTSCPDAVAEELHAEIDAAIERIFSEKRITARPELMEKRQKTDG